MLYREMAKGDKCSLLGFGCMRFPTDSEGKIDRVKSTAMLKAAMESGVNYFDTAYVYHNGESELFVGEFLKEYERESFYLATKLPLWQCETVQRAEEIFAEQLSKLQTPYIDYLLFHAIDRKLFEKIKNLNLTALAEKWRAEGKVRHIGFSFHDDYEVFEEMIGYYDWDFCQIQYNYMDTEHQAGLKGLRLAASKNIPVVVMEPIRGGGLVRFPEDIKNAFSALNPSRNLANWALSWVATHPEVKVILSGMSTMEQVQDNLNTLGEFVALSEEEMTGVGQIVESIRARKLNVCTGCAYCMPCPFGVDIPRAFRIANEQAMHGEMDHYK
ncbi:MAG: aldo/keto reductase, partial [Clostridia bacterium]|nr:aldo/keto reductase [Clostridia bacterium]